MTEPSVDDLARSFERHLRAERKSPRTIETYLEAVQLLTAFLSGLARKFVGVDHAACRMVGAVVCCWCRSIRWSRSSRSVGVNFHWKGWAVAL